MVFENRSYGSVRAPPLPIIRDHSKHQHHSTRISPDSGAAIKCNGTNASQLFNITQADKTSTNGHTNGHGTTKCTPTTTTTTTTTLNGRPPIARSASVTFQAGRLRRAHRKPLTIREYESDFRQQASDLRLVERVFYGGMEGNQLRAALWPYIFGLVPERGHFVARTSSSINGFHSTLNGNGATSSGSDRPSRNTSPRTGESSNQYIYIEHEKNVARWRELKQLYKTYKRQWRSIQPDQELRFSVFRERKSLIERDVVRSDRTHPFYAHDSEQAAANLKALTTLLMTYMMYDFDIGYLQGMSDLAAPILYVYDGDLVKSFWVFVEVMKLFRRNFEQSQKSIHFQLNCLNRLIKMTDPKLANYLRENDCSNCFFVFRCIVCQFKRELMKSSGSRAASQEEVNDGVADGEERHSDLTSSTEEEEDDDDDDDGCSSLDGGLRRHNGMKSGHASSVAAAVAAAAANEDSYAKVLNLWDTIWSVQRRHELLAESKYVHTYRIANGDRRKTQGSSAHAQHKQTHHHHHRHQGNHQHHNHQRMSSPINISSTTTTTTTTTNGRTGHVGRPYHTTNGSNQQQQQHQKLSSNNSFPRSPSSTTSASTTAAASTTATTATRLNHQLNRAPGQGQGQGRQSPKLTITTSTMTTTNGHLNSCSPQTNGTNGTAHPAQRYQVLKRHSVGSLSSLGSCCSQCCGLSAGANDGSRTAPVKQEEIVYTKETFYSSFDPNQADVPRFELTETEKFVLALCVSLIRRERNAILSQQMGVSEIHQHFINPPRLAENFDAFTEQAYETYEYLNTDCDLQLLVKGASELSGGAASDLSPICGAATTTSTSGTGNTRNSTDTADTFDLLKDYFVISPTAYNVSMSSLNNLPSSLSNSNLATSQNNNSLLISSSTHNNNSISTSDLNNRGGGGSGGGLKKRLSYCEGGSSGGSVSQKLWDHFLNSKTLNMQ